MKKQKRKKRTPPLSLLDKTIWLILIVLSYVAILMLIVSFEALCKRVTFLDPDMLAFVARASSLFQIPALAYLEISAITAIAVSMENRIPIFGNKKIRYGKDGWANIYPVFSKEKKVKPIQNVRPSAKKLKRVYKKMWYIGLLCCISLFPLGLFGRNCLTNNSIVSYNMFNQNTASYSFEDIISVDINNHYVTGYRTPSHWEYRMRLTTSDGNTFSFSNVDFNLSTGKAKLLPIETMQKIKDAVPSDCITIHGQEELYKTIDYFGLDQTQADALYMLFDYSP